MAKTGAGLVAWCDEKISSGRYVYCYGTYCNKWTVSKYTEKRRQYPSHYTDERHETYINYVRDEKIATDCIGLIKGYLWELDGIIKYARDGIPDVSARGMYNRCKVRGKISEGIPNIPGVLVFNTSLSHVGVYDGEKYVFEAQSFKKGCRKNKLAARSSFTLWGLCPDIDYENKGETDVPDKTPIKKEETEVKNVPTIRKGVEGLAVRVCQRLLIAHGYPLPKYGIDGNCGSETVAAIRMFQKDSKLTVDGVCGAATWAALCK